MNDDRGYQPYIPDTGRGSSFLAFLTGAVIGAGLALMFAPKSGTETREQVADWARRAQNKVKDAADKIKNRAEDAADRLKYRTEEAADKLGYRSGSTTSGT